MQAVIFDMWGTLVDGAVRSPLRKTHRLLAPAVEFGEFVEQFEKITMTAPMESQKDMFTNAADAMDLACTDEDVEKLIGIWNKNALLAKVFDDAIPSLDELKKKGIKLAIISNTASFHAHDVLDRLDLRKYFDVVALSYEMGKLKSDPSFLSEVIEKLGVPKEEILLVGDSVESDMRCADQAGVQGLLIDRRGRHEYAGSILSLNEVVTKV